MKDNKRLHQFIIVGVLLAFCIGYVTMKMTARKPEAAKPAPVAQAAKPADIGQGPSQTSDKPSDSKPADTAVAVAAVDNIAVNRRDPFAPTMDTSIKIASALPQRSGSLPPFMPDIGPLPPIGAGGQTGTGQQQAQKPVEEPFPPFVLTGVITGQTNVAIVRLGEGRYIVKEGQKINGIYEVVTVSQDGVLITRDGRSVFLKLGGNGNAS